MRFYFSFLFVCFSCIALAQHPEYKRANRWYFGNGAGLDFSSGSPVALTDGQLHSWESCASICDIDGNLLFYTDGDTIWNRNHEVMPNGTGLLGGCTDSINNSATQGVIIIPRPKSEYMFHVFTVDCAENLGAKGMNHSIVDLSLDGGFGDVTVKNEFLFGPSTESMAATMSCSGDSVWVVGHEFGTDAFYAYLVDENGLETDPTVSNVGLPVMNYEGAMKFSPNSEMLFNYINLFRFDTESGAITNPIQITNSYGVSFSPDSRYLYLIVSSNTLYQFDVSLNDPDDVLNSFQILYQGVSNDEYYGMQLGNDYRLYISPNDTNKLTTLDTPNNQGSSAGFNPYSLDLGSRKTQFTFPSFIENYFDQNYSDSACFSSDSTLSDSVFLDIPNVFTPNGDGVNDFFSAQLQAIEDVRLSVYNRWGTLVISREIAVSGLSDVRLWDGQNGTGSRVSPGVYYFVLTGATIYGYNEIRTGHIYVSY